MNILRKLKRIENQLRTERTTLLRNVASVVPQKAILENIRFAQLVSRHFIVQQIARNMIGKRNTKLNAKNFKQNRKNDFEFYGNLISNKMFYNAFYN